MCLGSWASQNHFYFYTMGIRFESSPLDPSVGGLNLQNWSSRSEAGFEGVVLASKESKATEMQIGYLYGRTWAEVEDVLSFLFSQRCLNGILVWERVQTGRGVVKFGHSKTG